MGLLSRPSREERFWRWFRDNSERLFAFESDQDRLFNELQDALGKVEKGLTFEFGPIEDGRREFVISADGIRELFPAVQRLADAAPRFSQWTIIPFDLREAWTSRSRSAVALWARETCGSPMTLIAIASG